jgi:nucleoid DNA-binding protein
MKKHVIEELRGQGLTGAEAERQFETVVDAIRQVLARGERVRMPGVGTLVVRPRAETRRRNPRTGEPMTIAGYQVVALRNPEKF